MSTGTKAKAWRGTWDHVVVHPGLRRKNCTVIPDGAPIPLPADVRRVLELVGKDRYLMLEDDALTKAWDAHERAEKRRKAGGR